MFGTISVQASTLLPSSYDWSTTQGFKQSKVLGLTTQDQELSGGVPETVSPTDEYLQFDRYMFGGGFIPSNLFYFVKPLQENIQLVFTFDQKAKDALRIQIAGERLDEMQRLIASNDVQAITAAADAYRKTMAALSDNVVSLKEKGSDVESLLGKMEEEMAKHSVVLEQVRVQVPAQSEKAIGGALEASWKGADIVADLNNRPAIPSDLVSRLELLKSQGLLTSEEVAKLIGAKSRVEARQEVSKFVNEGVVSASDFLRLNETAKSLYPEEFYKVHETLRFQEMQKLEDQKPDDITLSKIQSFAKTYKPGDQVPSDLRIYWAPVVKLEEIQNTLRPDLIDANLFKRDDKEAQRFSEVVERFKPRPEDIAKIRTFIQKNNADVSSLPPEYQRMYTISQRYGAQCGAGFNWVPESQSPAGGYCAPNGSDTSNVPSYNEFTQGKTCKGAMVNAKSSQGACTSFPSDCMPPGWNKVDTCVSAPASNPNTGSKIACPSNAHFVPVPYDPNGGYCIPNYTQVGPDQSTGTSVTACPTSSHRSYAGGPCVPDYNTSSYNNPYALTPLTTTPGGPYYTDNGRCGSNANWVPEPVNPNGGYCAPLPGTNGVPKTDMGNCRTPGECYDWCKANPEKCSGFNADSPRPGDTTSPTREAQEAACRAGGGTCVSWTNGACGCERSGSGGTGTTGTTGTTGGTGGGITSSDGSNTTSQYGTPTREAQEAACRAGGGTCVSWNNGACGCVRSGGTSGTSGTGGTPAGYGSCPSGQYWNGNSCQTPPTNTPSPTMQNSAEEACRRGSGCSWTGSTCNCPSTPSVSAPTTNPTPAPVTNTAPPPASTPNSAPPSAPAPATNPEPPPPAPVPATETAPPPPSTTP